MFSRPKALVRIGQLLLVGAFVLLWWMQRVEPSMSPVYAPISLYARLRHGWMMCLALLLMSAAIAAFSRAYKLLFPGRNGAAPLQGLSAAILLAAIFRAHTYFPWDGPPTVVGTIHMVFSVCAFALFACAAFVISAERQRRILKIIMAVFFAASAFTCAEAGMTLLVHQKPQYMGLEERVIMFIALAWFLVLFPPFSRLNTASAG